MKNAFALRATTMAVAIAAGLGCMNAAQAAVTITLQPDEASSKDVFVYEFGVPGVFGIPTPARTTNLDTATLDALNPPAAVPFGDFLGTSNTEPLIGAGGQVRAHDTKTLIQFDLSFLNLTAAQVGSAKIGLYAVPGLPPFADPTMDQPITTELRQVTQAWSETAVTWENRPMVSDPVTSTMQNGVNQWVEFDVTMLVQAWLTNPSANYGVELSQPDIVLVDGVPAAGLYFSSTSADPSLRPYLSVTAVPEPSTYALMAAGIGLLGVIARRRRAV